MPTPLTVRTNNTSDPGTIMAASLIFSLLLVLFLIPFVAVALWLGWNWGISEFLDNVGVNTGDVTYIQSIFALLGLAALRPIRATMEVKS